MKIETIAVHGGYSPEPTTKAVAPPIYQTTSYAFDSTQHGADLFDLKVAGNIYTRIMNPTTDVLEKRVAEMEGGIGGLALASGMAAITYAIMTIAEAGDNIVTSSTLYGGTYNLFAHTLPRYGIEVRFADYREPDSFAKLIDNRTKALFCESVGNPLGNVTDFEKLAELAHANGIPLIVDNTVPTPYLCRPFEHGADIVVHALTKYLGGHGNSIGGMHRRFRQVPLGRAQGALRPPERAGRLLPRRGLHRSPGPGRLHRPRPRRAPAQHGRGDQPVQQLPHPAGHRDPAPAHGPHLRERPRWQGIWRPTPQVSWVNYAGLPEHKDHALVQKYMDGKASGIVSFGIKGGREAGAKFIDALKLVVRLVNIGDAKSLACHPATTTHRQLSPEELAKAGVSEDLVRLSIGIEHIDDLMEDIEQALAAAMPDLVGTVGQRSLNDFNNISECA
jgi:O-acetylhomoserine (thiol)-lyase